MQTARRLLVSLVALGIAACRGPAPQPRPVRAMTIPTPTVLPRYGFTIQAGAFSKAENASRLASKLQAQGLDATYVPAPGGLFRVRFGDFRTREAARERAERLKASGWIEGYWIVSPEEQPATRLEKAEPSVLRRSLVETARSYLGVPYLWGGTSEQGFDCSGLALAVYQLNGLRLPRSSSAQFEAGKAVARGDLQAGDLVFFAMGGNRRVSHVGVYLGEGQFIHAPGAGRKVCVESLATRGIGEFLVGGRTYL